jgi:hypothetical protein
MNESIPCNASSRRFRMLILCAGLMAIAACATNAGIPPKGSMGNPVILTITWNATDSCVIDTITPDTNICQGSHREFCMPRSKWLAWQSSVPKEYAVYFSPFTKGSFEADRDGFARGKIDAEAPYALYKYSIVAEGCNRQTQVNDPHIRVDK